MESIHLPRLLIVDDNPAIHDDFRKVLTNSDEASLGLDAAFAKMFENKANNNITLPTYRIDSAYQGQEGLECVRAALEVDDPYALAFIDVRMPPGWDGIKTIQHIWEIDARIQIVICSAYSDYSWSDTIKTLGQSDRLLILKKPFDNVEIRQLACALTHKWKINQQLNYQLANLERLVNERTAALKATLESTTDGILVTDNQNKIVTYNQIFIEMWQPSLLSIQAGALNEVIDYLLTQTKNPQELKNCLQISDEQSDVDNFQIIECNDGRILECYSKPEQVNNKIIGHVYSFRDITKRKQMEEQLAHQATHDLLTGLPNRLLLIDRIQQAIANARRFRNLMAVVFFDLDRFKQINDSFGHTFGDKLLQTVAGYFSECIRDSDTLARLGGDEFVMVLTSLQSEDETLPILQKIMLNLNRPISIEGHELQVTASIGVSIYPKSGHDADTLLKNADAAMYRAKDLGRSNFQFYTDEMNSRALRRLELANALRVALTNNEFIISYQPLLDIKTGKIIGVEALTSWYYPKLGLISPTEFIKIAEELGLIFSINEWVLRAACLQNKAWQDSNLTPIKIAVNISPNQIKHNNFTKKIKEILLETNLDPKYLELELTESILVEGTSQVIGTLQDLKKLGVDLVIDDFGMGYSSLSYLSHFPISKIKIDKSFINMLGTERIDTAIVLAIITLAKNLNLQVLAEGVETKQQLIFLQTNNCDEVQGFYFSPAIDAQKIAIMLQAHRNLNDITD